MGKILKLFVLFFIIFTLSFGASEYDNQLVNFDRNYKLANHDKTLKYHHMLKNIYIQSIIKNDTKLKIKALQRLILTSKKLNLNSSSYEKELFTLKKMINKNQTILQKKPLNDPLPSKKNTPKKPQIKQKNKINIQKSDTKKILKISENTLKLTNISNQNGMLSLEFNANLNDLHVKTFVLKSKTTYRYVYDIDAVLTTKNAIYKQNDMEKIQIGQYNSKTIRVVFTSPVQKKITYNKINNKMNIVYTNIQKNDKKQNKPIKSKTKIIKSSKKFSPNSKIIVIDAGHGGKDGGAQGNGFSEKNIVLKVAKKVGQKLQKSGYKIYYTRTTDKFIQLRSRTALANKKNADLFVSIHANAAPNKKKYSSMRGIETFFLSPARSTRSKNVAALENKSDLEEMNHFSKQTFLNFLNREKIISSNKLAIDVQKSMLDVLKKKYKVVDGGVREAPFWVLVGAQMSAILIEIGYITHPQEGKIIATDAYQNAISQGIVDGINSYFEKNF